MTDWQVGDLALCVDNSDQGGCGPNAPHILRRGKVYTVAHVTSDAAHWTSGRRGVGLVLHGAIQPGNPFGEWHEIRFRKIKPDAHEACEPAFVTLLKLRKVSA